MDLVGQVINNRYKVEGFIGRGGMAEVYKVLDTRRMTWLAMKVLREDLAEDVVFLRRFRREAQTLARLQHPNIVRFYGLEQAGNLVLMLMDYIEGSTLRKELAKTKRPFTTDRVLSIMKPVCTALHYAHQEGIVHCDLKPGNILIENGGRVLLTDFGIARMMDTATVTMVGIGTPAYMAPELIRGGEPTVATDIYAMGVVLYEMLTGGERPFSGERAKTTGTISEKVRWEHLHLEPISPRLHNPKVSPELEAIVLKCLAKEPESRYQNTIELLNALEQTIWVKPASAERAISTNRQAVSSPPIDNERVSEGGKPDLQSLNDPLARPIKNDQNEQIVEQTRSKLRRKSRQFFGIIGATSFALVMFVFLLNNNIIIQPPPSSTPPHTNSETSSGTAIIPGGVRLSLTPTSTSTFIPTQTATATATATHTETATPTSTSTLTHTPTYTFTPTRTRTPRPPTAPPPPPPPPPPPTEPPPPPPPPTWAPP